MKKAYTSPVIEMENFTIAQQIASCGAMQINLTDAACVLADTDSTEEMKRLANIGFFLGGCDMQASGMTTNDGYCYNTNINIAFTS